MFPGSYSFFSSLCSTCVRKKKFFPLFSHNDTSHQAVFVLGSWPAFAVRNAGFSLQLAELLSRLHYVFFARVVANLPVGQARARRC